MEIDKLKSINPDKLIIQKLSKDHEIENFECGDYDLNDFLINDALHQMEKKLNVTYICFYENVLVAYFTLSSDSITINDEDEKILGIRYPQYPALKIGRLAVDKNYRNRRVGSEIILRVIGKLMIMCKEVGMRFISVDSYDGSTIFYSKNNFIKLEKDSKGKENVAMYFDPFRPIE